jgi:hypothetical protein
MTVGIAFTNGIEAINITDAQVSTYGRKSDSFDKSETFNGRNCHGVVFGTGNGDAVLGVNQKLADFEDLSLEELVRAIHEFYGNEMYQGAKTSLITEKKRIELKASILTDSDKRRDFLSKELENLQRRFDQLINENPFYTSELCVVGFDNYSDKIRNFHIQLQGIVPIRSSHIEVGSGKDGASSYLLSKLPGLDPRKLSLSQLAYYAINAYSHSNINQGVGGTPKITIINKDAANILGPVETLTLTNLSGAYLAEFNPEKLTPKRVKAYFQGILQDKVVPARQIAKDLRINEDALRTLYIPYSSWQERVNRK